MFSYGRVSGCGSVIWRFGGSCCRKYVSSMRPRRMKPVVADMITARGRSRFSFLFIRFSFLFMLF